MKTCGSCGLPVSPPYVAIAMDREPDENGNVVRPIVYYHKGCAATELKVIE